MSFTVSRTTPEPSPNVMRPLRSTIATSPTCRIFALHGIQIPSVFSLLCSMGHWCQPGAALGFVPGQLREGLAFPRLIQLLDGWAVINGICSAGASVTAAVVRLVLGDRPPTR